MKFLEREFDVNEMMMEEAKAPEGTTLFFSFSLFFFWFLFLCSCSSSLLLHLVVIFIFLLLFRSSFSSLSLCVSVCLSVCLSSFFSFLLLGEDEHYSNGKGKINMFVIDGVEKKEVKDGKVNFGHFFDSQSALVEYTYNKQFTDEDLQFSKVGETV